MFRVLVGVKRHGGKEEALQRRPAWRQECVAYKRATIDLCFFCFLSFFLIRCAALLWTCMNRECQSLFLEAYWLHGARGRNEPAARPLQCGGMKRGSDVLKRVRLREKNVTFLTCAAAAVIGRPYYCITAHRHVKPAGIYRTNATFSPLGLLDWSRQGKKWI